MGLAWLHCFTLAALVRSQLAVVRAFASDSEVEQLVQNFAHWNTAGLEQMSKRSQKDFEKK